MMMSKMKGPMEKVVDGRLPERSFRDSPNSLMLKSANYHRCFLSFPGNTLYIYTHVIICLYSSGHAMLLAFLTPLLWDTEDDWKVLC